MSSTSHTILIMLFCLLASLSALPALAYDNAYCSMKQVSTDPQRTARTETSGTKFIIYCEDKNNADVIVQTITHTCMYNAIGKNNIAITPNYSCSNIGGKSLTVSEWNNLQSRYTILCSVCSSPGKWTPGYLLGQ